jgi:hypothetical protein
MKVFFLFLMIHLLAYNIAKAQDIAASPQTLVPSAVSAAVLVEAKPEDECRVLLPQLETEYKELEAKFKTVTAGVATSQESYLVGFSQMTEILFQMVKSREEETAAISQSRDRLQNSMSNLSAFDSPEATKNLQGDYLDLTVRLYSSLMDAQKSLETLKTQLSLAETSRGQLDLQKQELEALDHQKLAIEGKLISLKIRCQANEKSR